MSSRAVLVLNSGPARGRSSHRPILLICPREGIGECAVGLILIGAFPERVLFTVKCGGSGRSRSENLPPFLIGACEADWPREVCVAQGGDMDDGAAVYE